MFHMKRLIFLIAAAAVAGYAATLPAEARIKLADNPADVAVAEAVEKAMAAAERAEQALRQARMTTRETSFEPDGSQLAVTSNTYLRDGDSVITQTRVISSADETHAEVGDEVVFGGSPQLRFGLVKDADDSNFSVEAYGASPSFAANAASRAAPLYAPFQVLNYRLADFLNDPGVAVKSVNRGDYAGRSAYRLDVTFDYPAEGGDPPGRMLYDFYFASDSWAFLGFAMYADAQDKAKGAREQRHYFEPGRQDTPRLQRMTVGGAKRPAPGLEPTSESVSRVVEVISLDLTRPDPDVFAVATYGVSTPASAQALPGGVPNSSTPLGGLPWSSLAIGVALLCLGVALAAVIVRRRREMA